MKTTIISYSYTGNNEILAANIAKEISAEHIRISERKKRTLSKIAFDMIFNRSPKVNPVDINIDNCDLVIFIGPVWMGSVASPFRRCLKKLKRSIKNYAFISISGGADGDNSGLGTELTKRMGKEPIAVIDMHIADLLPSDPKPTRKMTSAYQLNKEDTKSLTDKIISELEKIDSSIVEHQNTCKD